MKTLFTTAILVVALTAGARADVIRDLAKTGSTITLHGVFDGR